jgi:putative hydrolase of the HAD superfamily
MQPIEAIGFDLFDTLITVENLGFGEAMGRLLRLLQNQGFGVEAETFVPVYRDTVKRFREVVQKHHRETHNRFWISAALRRLGYDVGSDDARIAATVEAYFSAFLDHAVLLPGTRQMLLALKGRYRLGLLSNFTHAPAVKAILSHLGLTPFLDAVLISGELGYRKPHARAFHELARQFALPGKQIAFVGDDLEADINGAQQAGFQPIWSTYARVRKTASATESVDGAPPAIPTIASWNELLTLLDVA